MIGPLEEMNVEDLRREDSYRRRIERHRAAHPDPMDPDYIEEEEDDE